MAIFSSGHKRAELYLLEARWQSNTTSVSEMSRVSRSVVWALKTPARRAVALWVLAAHGSLDALSASPSTGRWWEALNTRHCVSSQVNHHCSRWEQCCVHRSFFQCSAGPEGLCCPGSEKYSSSPVGFLLGEMQTSTNTIDKMLLHRPAHSPLSLVGELEAFLCLQDPWRYNCKRPPCCQEQYCCSQ